MIDIAGLPPGQPLKIIVGANGTAYPGWLSTEEKDLSLTSPADWERSFPKGHIAAILAEHVWEHLTEGEGREAAKLCYEYLQPGGHVRCAVPDGYFQDEAFQNMIKIGGPGPKDHPAASHKFVYDHRSLSACFESAGFSVELLEYYDTGGEFHAVPWEEQDGFIKRTRKSDWRNADGVIRMTSLILDAIKPIPATCPYTPDSRS